MARYLIIKGSGGDRRYRLTKPIITIGRGEDCDIRLADTSISREHARLLVRESFCGVEDLGSSNGTRVNGQPFDGERRLASGDKVSIGNVEAAYLDEADARAMGRGEDMAAEAAPGSLSLQGFLEGDVSVDETIKSMSSGWSGGERRVFDWRFKLVALVAGTISLGVIAIGTVLVYQQRDAWLGRAVLELRQLAA